MSVTIVLPEGALTDSTLTGGQFRLLCQILAGHTDHATANTTVAELAERLRRPRNNVNTDVKVLETAGYLTRTDGHISVVRHG